MGYSQWYPGKLIQLLTDKPVVSPLSSLLILISLLFSMFLFCILSFLLFVFVFEVTPDGARIALCSGITPGGAWGPIMESWGRGHVLGKCLAHTIFPAPLQSVLTFWHRG